MNARFTWIRPLGNLFNGDNGNIRGSAAGGSSASWFDAFRRLPLSVLLALLVFATALPLLSSMLLMFNRLAANERESIRQSLMVSARTLADLVDNEIAKHAAIGVTLAQSRPLMAGDLAGFLQQANQALQFVPGSWLTVSDPQGQIVLSTLIPLDSLLPRHAAPDISQRAFASRQPQVSDLVFGPTSLRHTAFVEIPVFKDNAPLYSISISLAPARFLQLIENRFTRGELIAVLDRKARFIARVPDHDARLGATASEGWRAGIAKSPEGWTENRTLEGALALNAYTATTHGWTVGVSQLEAAIAASRSGIVFSTALGAVALVLLSLGFGTLLARYASQGMTALSAAARELGEGKRVTAPKAPFAEAAIIGNALEKASSELSLRQADLETRVAQRTAELTAEMQRREESDAQVRQLQKMDAIGQLSGGIAHDFNNMLAIVLSALRLLERRLERGERDVTQFTDGIRQGAERAVVLTQRLLAFARQQPLEPVPGDANKLISSMSDLLRRTIPESVAIETVLAGGLWRIHADANQLENALLNLATNARDAMPDGGKLTIETANAHLDDAYVKAHPGVAAGQYVLIAVTDTGTGMLPQVAEKAFEPFFTTKPSGRGTGLGLAQVYGFIKQSGGHAKIYNEPGHGVTVRLYLPRYLGTADFARPSAPVTDLPVAQNQEMILVVEDDPAVLDLTVGMLQELGYRALAARAGTQALQILASEPEIKLLLTDVVMPGMNGRQLADAAKISRPDLKALFATGYTRNAVVHNGVVDADVELISKPFSLEVLAQKVDKMLRSSI